ncbi:TrlF family AAA-like ATPase [uncultured Castellaniella sp.]|uniref:TrlF family AAA-like ATPase n=1 Tax=uncultured Castellaniella sp. TaxID=647907 RepID=UPI0026345231|nr:AAA family ATPase [uncultured Castellaniella sp.]
MITRGSEWHRWEPHIHAPGTILNNQFKSDDWNSYLDTLENASPPIEAIAITDYYTTTLYEEVCRYKESGRLPGVSLIIPNIEVRLDVAAKSGFVNLHLLVNPDDPNHVTEIRRFLSRLHFSAHDDRFDCTVDDLIRLGKAADPSIQDDRAALAHGATQFKVNFTTLRTAYSDSAWAKANILIGVAGGSGDGTSGLRQAADQTIRQEIEKFSHFIFTSNPTQREFWLGLRALSFQQLQERYGGCKPCMHGSDAHSLPDTAQPADDRFSWIKGALTFDALRQACIDPASRAYVGAEPPKTAMPSQVIASVDVEGADWMATKSIPLNSGLVAIIGARGSGKTALADMIAAGCDSIGDIARRDDMDISPSFLARARPLLRDSGVCLRWGGGSTTNRHLDGRDSNDAWTFARARYLSQQFVEELCSSTGASQGLIREIERVIFEAHTPDEQDGAINFEQLREQQTHRFQQARQREAEAIASISDRIATEIEKEALIASLKTQVASKEAIIKGYTADLKKFVLKGTEAQANRHAELSTAVQMLTTRITALTTQRRTFVAMQDEVTSTRVAKAPEMLRQAIARYPSSGLSDSQWDSFLLVYKGDVDGALDGYIAWADKEIANLTGTTVADGDPNTSLIKPEDDLSTIPLSVLKAEMNRLEKLISADTVVRKQYAALSKRINTESHALQALKTQLADAEGAAERRKTLQAERENAYGRLFEAVISEQQALVDLYAPLMTRLSANSGTLKKLSIRVSRSADVACWANHGEEHLIDCRKSGPFMGRGRLEEIALSELKTAWEQGSAADIQTSMSEFIAKYSKSLFSHAPFAPDDQVSFRQWSLQFAHWLFDTSHISVRYEILYDRSDIHKLSPGTRGIVLLLLYLALDEADDRPLIIDQPEENLDPKSVNDELVPLFMEARSKRQVIIVTHNANLVINTDADQIIVADASPSTGTDLPTFTYSSGGLEDVDIRKQVCDILEGGDTAFKERARRLRVKLER